MKKIDAYEFKDLALVFKKEVTERIIKEVIEIQLSSLNDLLDNENINEEEFYRIIGCSKAYAESTQWFIPSCYCEKNYKKVMEEVKDILKRQLYTAEGFYIRDIEK